MTKVVVITDASAGIGAATVILLAERGMSLVLVARAVIRVAAYYASLGVDAPSGSVPA